MAPLVQGDHNKDLHEQMREEHRRGHHPGAPCACPHTAPPRPPATGLPCYLNWGMTLSVISRMVFITTSRGTDAVQLTSNMISSELKFSRRKWMLSTTSSGVPNKLASAAVSGLAEPASVLPMAALP